MGLKYPLGMATWPAMEAFTAFQGSKVPLQPTGFGGDLSDPARNADAIKTLSYFLGSDITGICEAEPWMWYSHDLVDSEPMPAYHRNAIVMLVDQHQETLAGSTGDDWIACALSMRAYLRGHVIGNVMAEHLGKMGYSSRCQSAVDGDLIQNPAILMAGLGEVSRIGDTILNPFLGPRLKSVIVTTDLPLQVDLPIDFGLQDFCGQCRKCARECPCSAITYGPKILFNGYETWKADVEKCTRYRSTQVRGDACSRCLKVCPWNREDTVEAQQLLDLSIHEPAARKTIIEMDDWLRRGSRNPKKKWWFDLEIVDDATIAPVHAISTRDLNLNRESKHADRQRLAIYPPELQPGSDETTLEVVVPVDRKLGLKAYAAAESIKVARQRRGLSSEQSHTDANQTESQDRD